MQDYPLNEMQNEDNVFVKAEPTVIEEEFPPAENTSNDTVATNFQPSMNEEDIDHGMLNDAMKFECVSKSGKKILFNS